MLLGPSSLGIEVRRGPKTIMPQFTRRPMAGPGELPIEPASQLGVVVHPKTAKALGLTIPQALLLRADRSSIHENGRACQRLHDGGSPVDGQRGSVVGPTANAHQPSIP